MLIGQLMKKIGTMAVIHKSTLGFGFSSLKLRVSYRHPTDPLSWEEMRKMHIVVSYLAIESAN